MSVDDRKLIVDSMLRILKRIDPEGNHRAATNAFDALSIAEKEPVDVAFLDVEMPEMNGLQLARKLQERNPLINIIFITGYKDYAPEAFDLYASGFLVKPITEAMVRSALNHLRYQTPVRGKQRLQVRCFGNFEVFYQEKPMRFSRSKCKELFAYLIDRHGAECTIDMIIGNLWPEEAISDSRKSQLRVLIAELVNSLKAVSSSDALIRNRGSVSVNPTKFDCDYYRYLDGDPRAKHQYQGEYMTQYEFAEPTRAWLNRMMKQSDA